MNTAEALFVEHGFAGTSVDAIARQAGYNKNLLFQYFKSRQMGLIAQWEHPLACWLRDALLALTPPHLLLKQFKAVTSATWAQT